MSRIDFTPAHTTQIPTPRQRAQVGRLVERVARAAVHAAEPAGGEHADARALGQMRGRGDRRRAVAAARDDRREVAHAALRDLVGRGSASSAASSRPTRTSPPRIAIVAGTAPCSRTVASISRATRRLSGRGSPWAMIVLSSATTGRPFVERRPDLVVDAASPRNLKGQAP